MNRYICIHGHFYQPPRENPWLEEVELQDSAYPYHDWNQRITAECYAPNTAARILAADGKIADITNNYAKMSFNFGPTLLSWMERNDPDVYQAILKADRESQKTFSGHGSALAQCYNHMIMPLANMRDKSTQILWGLKDFESRFQRKAEGMWLPETAVDLETLDLLSEQGMRFSILAPAQAKAYRKIGDKEFTNVEGGRIDPKRPYLCRLPSGRRIALFFYDGPISQDAAFGELLGNGENFARRLVSTFLDDDTTQLVHMSTDGETYGHHHFMGEMALAYLLNYVESVESIKLTNYGEFLERFPPDHEVKIIENSSWSCMHGVQRWKENCGCHTGSHPDWTQEWRRPLRDALDWLRDNLAHIYETCAAEYFQDAWGVRNEYIDVILDRSPENVEQFLARHAIKSLTLEEKSRSLKLLEMQRHVMLMYTSCGWFFDEVSRIETIQILRYASRAIQLAEEVNKISLERIFVSLLEHISSNLPQYKSGKAIYEEFVKPSVVDLLRVGVHYAVSSLFEEYPQMIQIYSYNASNHFYERLEDGAKKLAIGKANIRSDITQDEASIDFAVFHLGDHNLIGGVRIFQNEKKFSEMYKKIKGHFRKGNDAWTKKAIEEKFEKEHYSLRHLFKDEQSKILYQIIDANFSQVEASLRQINEHNYPLIQVIKQMHIPLPKVLVNTVLVLLNADLLRLIGNDPVDFQRLGVLVEEIREWALEIDKVSIGFMARRKIDAMMELLSHNPNEIQLMEMIANLLRILGPLELSLNLWKTQNIYFSIKRQHYRTFQDKIENQNQEAQRWIDAFHQLGNLLNIEF